MKFLKFFLKFYERISCSWKFMKKCIDRFYFTIICGLTIGRVVVKIIGAVSWRDNNNLFIKFMVFSFIQLRLKLHALPTTCIWCNLHVLYMYACSKSESDRAKMEIKFRRHKQIFKRNPFIPEHIFGKWNRSSSISSVSKILHREWVWGYVWRSFFCLERNVLNLFRIHQKINNRDNLRFLWFWYFVVT